MGFKAGNANQKITILIRLRKAWGRNAVGRGQTKAPEKKAGGGDGTYQSHPANKSQGLQC